MTETVCLTVKKEVGFTDEFLKLKRERKLSAITNSLWLSHFNISKQAVPENIAGIDDELRDMAARKSLLLLKKEEEEKRLLEEKNRYIIIGGENNEQVRPRYQNQQFTHRKR